MDLYFTYEWKYMKTDLKFCPRCGHAFVLEDLHIENQRQLLFHNCKFVSYLDPKVVVKAIVSIKKESFAFK